MPKPMPSHNGFTLMEIIVVFALVSALIAVAIPRYNAMRIKMEGQEGANIVRDAFAAQKRYKIYNGQYTSDPSKLDIDARPARYFNTFYLPAGFVNPGDYSISCNAGSVTWLAGINSKNSAYSLKVTDKGVVVCTPCHDAVCVKMGYPDNW